MDLELPQDHIAFEAGSKEKVLQQLKAPVAEHRLQIQTRTEVTGIVQHDGVFKVQTKHDVYRAANVVLAVRRGNLRVLDVRGAESPHVKYTLENPKDYTGQHILIIGAGDSAAQAALMLVDNNRVTIANRSQEFRKMNPKLKGQIDEKIRTHQIDVYHNAHVVEIEPRETILEVGDEHQQSRKRVSVKADWVLCTWVLNLRKSSWSAVAWLFAKSRGSVIPTLKQSDSPLEEYRSETADGVYLIGSLIGGDQIKLAITQGAAVIDHILGMLPPFPGEEELMHKLVNIPGDSTEAKLHYLAACAPPLHAVPLPQLRDMVLHSTIHHVGAGQTIGRKGTYATALSMIIDGCVELSDQRCLRQHDDTASGRVFW